MTEIEWGYKASCDLEDVADYYGQFDPSLPETLIRRIYDAALPLIDHPGLGTVLGYTSKGKWHARKTPFLLIYEIRVKTIFIVRVVHAESDWEHFV
jgi:plasmid stabilization system protein ParE